MLTMFDIPIFLVIIASSIIGLYKGLIVTVINLSSFIASILSAIFLHYYLKEFLILYIKGDLLVSISSGVLAYIISLLFFSFIATKINLILGFISGGIFDRLLGVVFGFFRGLIISLCVFTLIIIFVTGSYMKASDTKDMLNYLSEDQYPSWIIDSVSAEYLDRAVKFIIYAMPTYKIIIPNFQKSNNNRYNDNIQNENTQDIRKILKNHDNSDENTLNNEYILDKEM